MQSGIKLSTLVADYCIQFTINTDILTPVLPLNVSRERLDEGQ
jgi:hypothetical protein